LVAVESTGCRNEEIVESKVVLHDHLDGGVRPSTVIDLAAATGTELPTLDVDELAGWFTISPGMPFAEAWQRFYVVIELLQRADALHRVAYEAVEDLAADGAVYAELRFAPLNHLRGGLDADEVLEAVVTGLRAGELATGCVARTIVCGIREDDPAEAIRAAHLAASWRDGGVVGFDLAGNEFDYPVGLHAGAYEVARTAGLGITVHAGEMAGPESIADALESAKPTRIGHGLRLIEDCDVADGRIAEMGDIAGEVLDGGLTLEVCVTSNSCLGTPVADHPVRLYRDAGFRLSVNADDRAITTTTLAREYELWRDVHRFTNDEFREINLEALEAAFCDDATKAELRSVIAGGW
jgi:adenosine deaminase